MKLLIRNKKKVHQLEMSEEVLSLKDISVELDNGEKVHHPIYNKWFDSAMKSIEGEFPKKKNIHFLELTNNISVKELFGDFMKDKKISKEEVSDFLLVTN